MSFVGVLELGAVVFGVAWDFAKKNFMEFEPKTDCFDVTPKTGLETMRHMMSNKRF